jgi:tRNA A-37 threonylcarbamoyl transferase component Bud32
MPSRGPLVARGRDADVYAFGADRVLRRYREPSCTPREVAVMEHARGHGFPVPRVYELSPTDIVMDRVDGPTMIDDLARRPWRIPGHARTLAELHRRLHRIAAPGWLGAPLGPGHTLVHLDLHPLNVILTRHGPVVIDWANAARGEANADVALTWLLLATGVPDGRIMRIVAAAGRRLFAGHFLRRFPRAEVMAQLDAAAAYRLRDPNVRDAERRAIQTLLARAPR